MFIPLLFLWGRDPLNHVMGREPRMGIDGKARHPDKSSRSTATSDFQALFCFQAFANPAQGGQNWASVRRPVLPTSFRRSSAMDAKLGVG